MPAPLSWIHHIPAALESLKQSTERLVHRQEIEKLLQIKSRRAQDLMSSLGAIQDGKALAVDRLELIRRLELKAPKVKAKRGRMPAPPSFQEFVPEPVDTTSRVARVIQEGARELRLRQTVVHAKFADLKAKDALDGIDLKPHLLTVRFTDAAHLWKLLMLFVWAAQNEPDRFARMAEGKEGEATRA